MGDSTHPVTALCPLYETLLAFTSDRIWNISFDKDGIIQTEVFSFTKNRTYSVCVSSNYLTADDRVLFVDDFLANGNAAKGIIDLVEQSGATLEGMGFLIEKGFQRGGDELRSRGIHIESLAIIDSLDNCTITFR